jgi:hypothetical protein
MLLPGSFSHSLANLFPHLMGLSIQMHQPCQLAFLRVSNNNKLLPKLQSLPTFVVVILMVAILTGMMWNLYMVFTCLSFMAKDVRHFFMCFLTIYSSSFEKALFSSFAYFFTGSLIWGEFAFLNSLYILVINPLSEV